MMSMVWVLPLVGTASQAFQPPPSPPGPTFATNFTGNITYGFGLKV